MDIAILARDPRSIYTTAPEKAKSAGSDPDPRPGWAAGRNISYNEFLLPWLGASGRSNYVGFFLATIAVVIALIVSGSVC